MSIEIKWLNYLNYLRKEQFVSACVNSMNTEQISTRWEKKKRNEDDI